VHRKRTRLAARVHRLALGLERRGIRATYELHDRLLSNRAARRRLAQRPPRLDEAQRALVADLDRQGYAVTTFADLAQDAELWSAIEEQGRRFQEQTEAALAGAGATELKRHAGKEFVVRLHSYGVDLGLDDPWFRFCLSRRLLDVANAYLRLWSKLEYVDLWYSIPQPPEAERRASQRWHRDYNDRHLLKAFLYLVDVDEETGPFQYVPGSQPGGPYADAWPWRPLGQTYPPEEELAQRIPPDAVKTFTAPKGTLILCNTSGFHRGGFATGKPRVLATATYSSPASLASLTERSYAFRGDRETLDPEQRYAVS
jgi:ectoine hydroxylase-related dioxygenase (phytanoyl-CoA dioxygenase family)